MTETSMKDRFLQEQYTQFWLTLSIILLSFIIQDPGAGAENLYIFGLQIPPTCLYKLMNGFPCPGCGLTRCFVSISHGNFANAFAYHKVGILLYFVILFDIFLRLYLIKKGKECFTKTIKLLVWLPGFLCMITIGINWIYQLFQYYFR